MDYPKSIWSGGAAKFGTSKKIGEAETPSINCGIGVTSATLTFKSGAWSGDATTLKLSYTNCSGAATVTLKDAKWSEYTVELTNITGNIKIKFTGNATSDARFFLDDVVVSTTDAPTTYKVTYNANGATSGTAPTDATSYTSGTTVTVKSNSGNLAKTGYTFGGWNTKDDGTGTNYTAGSGTFTITDNTTLYAKWNTATKYTVTLDAGPGTCAASVTEASAGAGVTLPTPTLDGCDEWSFAGWKTTSAVTTETTTEPTLIPAGAYSPTSDITLYAVYQRTETSGDAFAGYEKVNEDLDDWSGKYLLSTGTYTANGTYDSNGANGHLVRETYIPGNEEKAAWEFTLANVENVGYSILFPDGSFYLGYASSTNFQRSIDDPSENNAYLWTPSINGITNVSDNKRKIQDGGSDFRPYAQEETIVYLYKRVGGSSTTYYHSTPDCSTGDPCDALQAPDVTATATANSITLSWDAVDGATSYNVFNYTTEELDETTNLTYTFNGLDPETEYEWEVEAVSATCDGKGTKGTTTTSATPCEKLGAATELTVATNYVHTDGKTYVKFSWTPAAPSKEGTTQELCYGLVGQEKTCTVSAKHLGEAKGVASNLPAGEYEWSIQALGDGTNYCDGDVVKGTNFYIYSITYNTNDGNPIAATSGTTLPDPLPTTTKTGYTFAGWYTDSEFNTPATAGAAITQNTTLYAKWTINQYTVTLNPNYPNGKTGTFTYDAGELVDGNLVLTYDYNTASMTIEDLYTSLTLDGYEFGGWFNAKGVNPGEVSGSKCTITGTITGNKTYYAKWSKLYSITLSENGTTTTPITQTSTSYTLPTELSAGSCQEDTKELVGWSTVAIPTPGDKPASNFYELGETVTLTEDQTTFYAVFATAEGVASTDYAQITDINNLTDGKYVIAYGYNTATPSIILKAATKDETTLVATSASPSSDKYQNPAAENIWSIKKNGTTYTLYNDATSKYVQANTTPALLLADANPTNFNIEYSTDHWKIKINGNTSYQLVGYTNATGNYFQTKSGAGNGYKIQLYKNTSTVSYSAYTTLCDATKATITYDLNGGTGATCEPQTVTKGEEFDLCDQTPTKEGYEFAGWTDGVNTYAAGATVTVNESTTFYAKWNAKTITITWDQNYTDCPEAATSTYIYDGEEIAMPAEPIRTGYKFTGWFDAATDGTQVTEVGETNKPTTDVTYYAHWAELYTVTFMASGQVYVVQEHKYLSGETLELPADPSAANYACDGYIFEGWSTYQQTKEDANRPELVDDNTSVENDLELHAVWKKASTSGAGTQIFYESFDDTDGTGGNDKTWSGNIATSDAYVDNVGWEGENVYGANKCIKLGGGSAKGSITTPALSQLSGNATLSFKAGAWNNNNETTTLKLSISGGGTLNPSSVTMSKGAWTTYEVQIIDGTPSSKITFEAANASNNRFFLDEVMITTSGSYNYTTSPNCGPTIIAKDGMWVTSAKGQSVKVNVPIAVKAFTTTATITGTSANENFVITPLENVNNGINDVVEVIYTPTTADTKESATITLTAKDGETVVSTTTFTLNGRSLPDQFAIVVDKASEYYALPANMPSEGTYTGFGVEVDAGTVVAAPMTHLYTARAVHSTRFTENGTALRLVGNNDACLWASAAKDGTSIRNYANISNATDSQYEWNLYTEDGETYRISCTAVTEKGRILRMYGQKFGMYKSGNDAFRILPVECTSTPLNVSVSAARTSATISWTNADACNVEAYNGSTKVQTISAAASPVVVSNLAESTAYTFILTPADNESCVASGAFTTTGPTIDIVEWETKGIVIQVDKDDNLNPKVVISGEVEHGDAGGNVADELFFSKYFESHGENKLLAIFNGTTATIDLNGYTIKSENGILDLSQFGQTKGKVASNEEIILVYYDANYSAEECAEEQQGYENWNILTEKGVLAFSGRGSLGLYKNDVLIDVIGSTFPSGELTKIGKSDQGCGTGDDVRLHIDGKSVNDQSSFFCFNGDNIKTDEVETNYALSTNRCLLIRKNKVTSGATAVATNKATVDATCDELSSTFATLCSEWSGFRIGSGSSSSDEIQDATCDGLGYVGGFDYNNYYRTLETLENSNTLEDYTRNADENTYFIEIENLAQYSCLNIQLQLADDEGNILTQQTSQVPILVTGEKSTTDPIFSAIVKDSETSDPDYETSKIRCSTCDVVILKDATLTKADAETVNDVNQVRDIYIYPGGKLVVPAEATDFSVNNISLRRVEDEVSMANVQTSLQITSSAASPIYVDLRVNAENWHWFTLPYNCNIANVTWADGSKAIYNADWFLMYYDGESRSNQKSNYESHWKVFEGTTLEAGKGYIVGITGHPTKSKVKYELRFPMAQEVLTAEQTDKTVAVNAWGVKKDIRPNHKGWNLVGNPYMDYYQPSTNGFAGLPLIKYADTYDPNTGLWDYEESGNVPFLVIPQDGGWSEYKQELASDVQMMPFTAYFVQVGDPANDSHSDGMELKASFEADKRGRSSLIRRAPSEVDELENPAIVAVSLTNAKGESDKTTLLIADRFNNEYEMNADFFKWFGDYYTYYTKPVLYTIGADNESRAFNALNEELAAQPVALGMYAAQAGEYTFSLHLRSDLGRVEEVWLHDAISDTHTNLMLENYTFSTNQTDGSERFSLSVKMMPKIATSIDNIEPGTIWATAKDNEVIVNGLNGSLQLWLYDAVGKLLYAEPTTNYQHRYTVPQDGVYFITVKDVAQVRTIKVVVE